jgi:opacity protein-like surface antigen
MKKIVLAAVIAAAAASGAGITAVAQNAQRTYDNGPVWQISYIESQPGMFDDYMQYLSTGWRQGLEAEKRAGNVLDYKVLGVANARDGEPDVVLITQFKNMAVFDESLDALDRRTAAQWGSVQASNQGYIDREKLRKQRGSIMARELRFKTPVARR